MHLTFAVLLRCLKNFLFELHIKTALSNHLDFKLIRCVTFLLVLRIRNIRCLQYLRYLLKIRTVHYLQQCLKTNLSETEILMTVLMGAAWILAVIDMENRNLILSDHLVKLCHHP